MSQGSFQTRIVVHLEAEGAVLVFEVVKTSSVQGFGEIPNLPTRQEVAGLFHSPEEGAVLVAEVVVTSTA